MWYKKIPFKQTAAARHAGKLRYGAERPASLIPQTIPNNIYKTRWSQSCYIQGYKVKLISFSKMIKFLGLPKYTLIAWKAQGILPEPYMRVGRRHMYLSVQVKVLAVVLNDFHAAGYASIFWSEHEERLQMLRDGYEEAMVALNRRMTVDPLASTADKFGVVLD